MPSTPLEFLIEAILFFKSEPISIKKIAALVEKTPKEVEAAIATLAEAYATKGIRLVRNDDEVVFRTAPEASDIISKITKEELTRDLGKAGLEVLSTILYKGPISRREIDYIRGVNSSFILRNLLIRGLIEKTEGTKGERSFTYKPTFELLSYMGIGTITELPEYEKMGAELAAVEKAPETTAEKTQEQEQEEKHGE